MRPVSETWINNNNKTIRDRGLLRLDFIDTHFNNSISASRPMFFNTDISKSNQSEIWHTEPYLDVGNTGYVSVVSSGVAGAVNDVEIFDIKFTPVANLSGITIRWSNNKDNYATKYSITSGSDTFYYTNDKNQTYIPMEYKAGEGDIDITLRVQEWSKPNSVITVDRVFVGMWLSFDQDKIFDYSNSQTMDPMGNEIPQSSISFQVDNSDLIFDPLYYLSVYKYLSENTEIRTYYGFDLNGNIEYVQSGVHYLTEWKAPNNTYIASFVARDILNLMGSETFFSPDEDISFEQYVDDLFTKNFIKKDEYESSNLPVNPDGSPKYFIPTYYDFNIKGIYKIDSKRNILQLITQAAGRNLSINAYGNVTFEDNLSNQENLDQISIPMKIMYDKPEFEVKDSINSLNVLNYNYTPDDNWTELLETTLEPNEEISIIHDSAYTDIKIEHSHGSINHLEVYSDQRLTTYIKNNSNTNIEFKVLRKQYIPTKVNNVESLGKTGVNLTIDNYLINTKEQSNDLLEKWLNDIKNDRYVSFSMRIDPSLELWDNLAFEFKIKDSPYRAIMRVEELDVNYNGAYMGKVSGTIIGTIDGETIPKIYNKISNAKNNEITYSGGENLQWFSTDIE